MKNSIFVFTAAIVFSTCNLFAQLPHKFDFGVLAGPSLASMRGNTIIDNYSEPKIGFAAGLSFQYNTRKILSFHTGILFDQKGTVFKAQLIDSTGNLQGKVTTNSNMNYLTVPLLVRASFGKHITYFVNAGPYFSYMLQHVDITRGKDIETFRNSPAYTEKRFDAGISAGIGAKFPLKENISLTCEARNSLGLTDISNTPVINNGKILTNSASLLIGITYSLGARE